MLNKRRNCIQKIIWSISEKSLHNGETFWFKKIAFWSGYYTMQVRRLSLLHSVSPMFFTEALKILPNTFSIPFKFKCIGINLIWHIPKILYPKFTYFNISRNICWYLLKKRNLLHAFPFPCNGLQILFGPSFIHFVSFFICEFDSSTFSSLGARIRFECCAETSNEWCRIFSWSLIFILSKVTSKYCKIFYPSCPRWMSLEHLVFVHLLANISFLNCNSADSFLLLFLKLRRLSELANS